MAVFDATEADFEAKVIARSREVPVVVDFWAEWCAPCRALGPVLERAVAQRAGKVELAKVDVDSNRALQARYGVQGIPAVKAFRDGRVASEFTGALPPAQVERFLDSLLPSAAEEQAASAVEQARGLLAAGDPAAALALAEPLAPTDFVLAGLAARARLEIAGDGAEGAFAAWDEGDVPLALDRLQAAVAQSNGDAGRRDELRAVMVAIFTELGPGDPLAGEHRRRLAAALN